MKKVLIAGGGISGLTLAHLLVQKNPSADVTVLEAGKRPGGKIWSDQTDGFLCEKGPNGFLDNKPKTLELCRSLGIETVRSNENSKKRFIFSGGKLNALPESPQSFIKSDLMSWSGKLRLLYELMAPKGPEDETVAEFIDRRLGREALEKLIDPMCSGIYAGNPHEMSIRHCFPRIKELEQEYGSLIRAMMKIKKQRKAQRGSSEVSAAPGGNLTSFYNGAQTLTDTLAEKLGEKVILGAPVSGIVKENNTYKVFTDKKTFYADVVIIASPAHASAEIVRDLDKELSDTLALIPYPHVSVIGFGYRKENITHPLNGFGFLVPHIESRKILGNLWDSSIFPNRAAKGHVLLRTMVGGAKHPETAELDDDRLISLVFDELRPVLGLKQDPDMIRVYRWEKAIPQYTIRHENILDTLNKRLAHYRGLYLTGNAYRGIGINDCVENSHNLAELIDKKDLS